MPLLEISLPIVVFSLGVGTDLPANTHPFPSTHEGLSPSMLLTFRAQIILRWGAVLCIGGRSAASLNRVY